MKYEYIMSTSFFITIRNYYPRTFTSFWERMDKAVVENQISSVSEVREDLENFESDEAHFVEWAKRQRSIFSRPEPDEQDNLKKLLSVENGKFQTLVEKKNILKGDPVPDPFVIAKAMTINANAEATNANTETNRATVVSVEEQARKDVHGNILVFRIPDVCEYFKIRHISPKEFMEEMEWIF